MREEHTPLLAAALALALLPFALDLAGLPLRSAIDVVVFAIACMGLNVLLGHTGLVSFGHGAWFGLGAYAAALSQRYWFPGGIILPSCSQSFSWRQPRSFPARSFCGGAESIFRCSRWR
jgi:branched-chain amino acid transport system ATP-binding protein/branched-chain amino acid transport system permease protein